jgi:hypothetical protein
MIENKKPYILTAKDLDECYTHWPQVYNQSMFDLVARKAQRKLLEHIHENDEKDVHLAFTLYDLYKEFGIK